MKTLIRRTLLLALIPFWLAAALLCALVHAAVFAVAELAIVVFVDLPAVTAECWRRA